MKEQNLTEQEIQDLFEQSATQHQNGAYKEAEAGYRKLLELFPEAFLLNFNLGLLLQELQEFSEALIYYNTAAQENKNHPDLLFNTGLSYKQIGETEKAINSFQTSLQIEPNCVDTLYNIGGCYRELNQLDQAVTYYKLALDLDSEYQPAISNLAYTYHRLGNSEKALESYQKLLQLNPEHKGSQHMIATITGSPLEKTDNDYIAELFDDYSDHFEHDLINHLHYQVPQLLKGELKKVIKPDSIFRNVLDLGCGTGLAGAEIKPFCQQLTGIDLSPKMIQKAEQKKIYDQLESVDITEFLTNCHTTFDLFLAADVFSYIGKLEETFKWITTRAAQQALIVFSIETTTEKDLELGKTGRFKHSKDYIKNICNTYNLNILSEKDTELRKESGKWVDGTLFVLQSAH